MPHSPSLALFQLSATASTELQTHDAVKAKCAELGGRVPTLETQEVWQTFVDLLANFHGGSSSRTEWDQINWRIFYF